MLGPSEVWISDVSCFLVLAMLLRCHRSFEQRVRDGGNEDLEVVVFIDFFGRT